MAKKNETTTTSQSQTGPWTPAVPLLKNLIGKISGISTDVTPEQTAASNAISEAAGGIPSFGSDIFSGISRMFGTDTTPEADLLKGAFSSFGGQLAPLVDPENLNPYNTPGFSDAISTAMNDITNKVKGVFAGSGRDPSGAGSFAKTLGRGLTEGIAPTIASQFNANRGMLSDAASKLFSGAGSLAGQLTGLGQVPLQNIMQGIGLVPAGTSAALSAPTAQAAAAQSEYGLPWGNLSPALQAALGIGSLGGTQSGTQTTSQPQSTFSNIMGGLTGGAGLLSSMGAFGPSGWLLSGGAGAAGGLSSMLPLLALSDERAKENIEEIGELHDGQPVIRFTYKGMPNDVRIGLLAQDVLEHEPDAVYELPDFGLLAIDHKRATDRAAEMGRR